MKMASQLWSKQGDGGASQECGEAKGVTSGGKMKRFLDLYDIQVEMFLMALPGDSVPVLNLAALPHSLPQAMILLTFLKLDWGHTTHLTKNIQRILLFPRLSHKSQLTSYVPGIAFLHCLT